MKSAHDVFQFIKASLNLFKAVPHLDSTGFSDRNLNNLKNLESGFFILGNAFQACPYVTDEEILSFIKDNFGYDIFELHPDLDKYIKTAEGVTPQQILVSKILQYLSLYGMDKLGNFEKESVYIPNDALGLPEDSNQIKIAIIGVISKTKIEELTLEMIESGAVFSEDTIANLADIMNFLDIEFEVDDIPNQELSLKLCDKLKVLPKNPAQFLRYMIYHGTGSTLLIKNNETIENLKNSNFRFDGYFVDYIQENGIAKLASVFHRFKPLWLAFKPHSDYLKATINKIRKLADRYHKPVKPKLLEHLTSSENINFKQLRTELSKIKTDKKISLANALLYRSAAPENIVYDIRNGKTFVVDYSGKFSPESKDILDVIINSIVEDIKPKVDGKKIYIPQNFNYAVPVNEKKFVGNIPYGSYYTFKSKACVVGVHWFNLFEKADEIRVDLDLHLNGNGIDISWISDSSSENSINTKDRKIVCSGDMTDAPISAGGASEAFLVGEMISDKTLMLNLNHYNHKLLSLYNKGKDSFVPFKLVLANVEKNNIDRKYLLNAHEKAFCVPFKIDSGGMFLGFVAADENGDKKFYFCSRNMGGRVVAQTTALTNKFNSAMSTRFENLLILNDVLERAGAILENVDKSKCDINLDPADVTKDTLMNLFVK